MVVVELSLFPVGKGEHLSHEVARVLKVIDRSGLHYDFWTDGH